MLIGQTGDLRRITLELAMGWREVALILAEHDWPRPSDGSRLAEPQRGCVACGSVDQPAAQRLSDRCGTVGDGELGVDVVEVSLDR